MEASLADWLRDRQRSMLRQMVKLVSKPGILSLAGGLPEPELFPTEQLAAAYAKALATDPRALQYGGTSERLKEQIVELASRRGIRARPEEVVLTTGAQQGIDIAVRSLLEQGGTVLLDEMSYTGIHQTAAPRTPEWLETPVDLEHGSDAEAARELLDQRKLEQRAAPDLAYLIPDGHNPLGVSVSEERRQAWAELLARHQVPLIEDDPYGLVWFEQEFAAPFKARIPEWTLYLSSFSKILAPGLRLGFMLVPEALAERIGVVKESGDLECSGLTQRAVSTVLEGDFLDDHLNHVRGVYAQRRDALLEALDRHLTPFATWTRPRGGMFSWLELNADLGIESVPLLERSLEQEQVAFLPGIAFSLPGSGAADRAKRSMRLSFSTLSPELFDGAVAAIARQVEQLATRHR